MKLANLFTFLLVACMIVSCVKDNNTPLNQIQNTEEEEENDFSENFGNTINARFIGTIVDIENRPLSGVLVNIDGTVITTDINGIFSITEASVFDKFAYIKASKEGYISGSRALVPTSGVNQVKITLLKNEPVASINSGEFSTVSLTNGANVEFFGDFVDSQNNTYSGEVQVVMHHLSPDDENMDTMMPGMLFAENETGDAVVLETYGMIAVKLLSPSGEELQLASDAQITVPLPASITNAPSTIPLWYFDEETGYWKEEGEATLQGNMYVGTVSHFSFWNCDAPFETIQLCVTLVDDNGNPIPNTYVVIEREGATGWRASASGISNEEGQICGLAPANEELTLVIPNYGCIANDFSTTIGPFTTDQNITITVVDDNAIITNFIGVFNDCTGNPITNGYMQLFYNNETQIIPLTNGEINHVIDYCGLDTAYSAQVVDLDNNQTTDVVSGNFTSPETNLGTQMSCVDLVDSDNDGVLDIDEDINGDNDLDNDDTDQDGTPNYLDEDDDGDGINTADEDYDGDNDPTNDDSDGDGTPDYLDSQDVQVYGAEVSGTGCIPNLVFDFDSIIATSYSQLINNTYTFYLTEADALADINSLTNPFTDDGSTQIIFVRATNTITNQFAVNTVYLFEEYIDSDQDGLTDCEETTGINVNTSNSNCDPNGNITDPNDADSDDDGFNDCEEAQDGTDPNDASDFPIDTDGDGVTNNQEIIDGTDPTDPCDSRNNTAPGICAAITANPTGDLAAADCDGDGDTNQEECNNGTNPADICSNSYIEEGSTGTDICDAITANPTGDLATADCDGDGVDNATECTDGTYPSDPCSHDPSSVTLPVIADLTLCDVCDGLTDGTALCLEVDVNPYLGTLDCDGDGVDNTTECANGTDPTDSSDF